MSVKGNPNEERTRRYVQMCKSGYNMEYFGDHLAKREGYPGASGMDAIILFLVKKYHWTPAQIRSMSTEDLCLVLSADMKDWEPPADAPGPSFSSDPGNPFPRGPARGTA